MIKNISFVLVLIFLIFLAATESGRDIADQLIDVLAYSYDVLASYFWDIVNKVKNIL